MESKDVTVGALAKASGLARSTLLYYDRLGLLRPSGRNRASYRMYSQADVDRLEQICVYRRMGIPLKEIARVLSDSGDTSSATILKRRLASLEREINDLRRQQRCIVDILQQSELRKEDEMLTKERWTAVMRAAGLDDDAMHNWHIQFEKMEPDAHQEFLESLGTERDEIDRIREWARKN
ncbi:MAG: MerR family transcriptional regulator [Phycisphaerales bacterium]|nr:MAG: MerR family transcriptional regulator [Phycisphaerales bacterium]